MDNFISFLLSIYFLEKLTHFVLNLTKSGIKLYSKISNNVKIFLLDRNNKGKSNIF